MHQVKPKKHLGQHFLIDSGIANQIVNAIESCSHPILEIGPGTGALTELLLPSHPDLYVIELDKESVAYLQNNLNIQKDHILEGDFLQLNLSGLFNGKYGIIGNFPYNISSQILFKILEQRDQVETMVGMFQKEVGERVCSPPGNKTYGILSVLLQAYYNVESLFLVDEHCFKPPPRVKSIVIRLSRNTTKQLDCDEKVFVQLVKASFNHRRKTLRNALKSFTFDDKSGISGLLDLRAEQLHYEDFIQLTKSIIP